MRGQFPPQTVTDKEMLRLSRLLFNLKYKPISVATLAHCLFSTEAEIKQDIDQLWFARAPITYVDAAWPKAYCDPEYTLDEAQRSLSNLRCPEHCFKAKFDGRYFKERLLGSRGEARVERLLDTMEARFGLPFEV